MSFSCFKKFNSESKVFEQTHGYLNKVAKILEQLQRGQYALQKLTAKGHKKRLKHRYM